HRARRRAHVDADEERAGRHPADGRLAPRSTRDAVLPDLNRVQYCGVPIWRTASVASPTESRNTVASSRWVIFSSFRTGDSGGRAIAMPWREACSFRTKLNS